MAKKAAVILSVFLFVGLLTVVAASLPLSDAPQLQAVTLESPCPVAACSNGSCHSYDDVPDPDGVTSLACPESSCSSTECHAWDSLINRSQASDISLNLWIILPALIVAAVVLVARRR